MRLHEKVLLAAVLMEPYGPLVDDLSATMSADETAGFRIDGSMSVTDLRAILTDNYGWALETDWSDPDAQALAWYTSEEKLEPRLGNRFNEPIAAYEQPLCPGRDAAALFHDLAGEPADATIAAFLLRHPEHRHTVRRAQIAAPHR